MVQRRDECDGCHNPVPGRDEDHGGADAGRDDSHVLNRAVRKQPLHLALDGRVENADERRKAADHQNDQPRSGPCRRRKVEIDPHDAVNSQIDDDRRQQCRDVCRRHRMGQRQPAIEGDEPGFHRESEEREQEDGPARAHR